MLLVRTPAPYRTESLHGYILRVAETNGYSSAAEVLAVAGVPPNLRKKRTGVDIGKLAMALGRREEEIKSIDYSGPASTKSEAKLLGQRIIAKHLRLFRPMLCPTCIAEKGFIEALWDSALVIACPRHGTRLLGACHVCGAGFMNYRKGLLKCSCGANLLDAALPTVDDEIIDLMSVLAAKIVGDPLPRLSKTGIPIADLAKMSLRTLQMAIAALGWQKNIIQGEKRVDTAGSLVAPAAAVLKNWPINFYDLLREIDESANSRGEATNRFLKRYQSINGALFKKAIPEEEIKFMREAFVRYGTEIWDRSITRFKRVDVALLAFDKKLLTRREVAEHLGTSPRTVTILEKEGAFSLMRLQTKSTFILCAEKSKLGPARGPKMSSLGARTAAKFLGIPMNTLRLLRASGEFEINHISIPRAAYHMADLIAFAKKLKERALSDHLNQASLPPERKEKPPRTLRQVLKGAKFLSSDGPVEVIKSLLDGRLKAYGIVGDAAGDLLLRHSDCRRMILEYRSRFLGKTRSTRESAQRLDCAPSVVLHLVKEGYLEATQEEWGNRITEESLSSFSSTFESLSSLAKKFETSSARLNRICEQHAIPLLKISRSSQDCPQSFLSLNDKQTLQTLASVNAAERNHRRLMAAKKVASFA